MKTEFTEVSETRKHLSFEVPQDVVESEIARVAQQYARTARVPGFRQGKVPAKVVRLTFGVERRFTQDTPIMAQVWTKYACAPDADGREDLIITAHNRSSSFEVASAIAGSLGTDGVVKAAKIAALRNDIAASLTFEQLILHALPLTAWWQDRFAPPPKTRGLELGDKCEIRRGALVHL